MGRGGYIVSVGEAAVAARFSSGLIIGDQNQLFDSFIGRVLNITANGRKEIQPDNGCVWLVPLFQGNLKS